MNIIIIISVMIVVSSTLLVRPSFWKIIQEKMALPKNCSTSPIIAILICQIFVALTYFILFIIGIDYDLFFFNGFTIAAIVALIVNICMGNYALAFDWSDVFKRKNIIATFCVLIVFSVLTIVLNVQFSKVNVPTTEIEAENLEDVLLDETISIERADIVKAIKLIEDPESSCQSYSSNERTIYWFSSDSTAVILYDNKAFVKEYDTDYLPSLKFYKKVGHVVDDDNRLYRAFAIVKYKDFKFYVDHYSLYDYANGELIECEKLPTWATNQ